MEILAYYTNQLQSSRLILRTLKVSDALEAFDGWTSDVEVGFFMPWNLHSSVHETEEWLANEVEKIKSPKAFNWGIVEKNSKKLIGTIGINIEGQTAELGYCISKKHWNRGYATEAIQEVLLYSQNKLNLKFIYARVAIENTPSAFVLKKLQFKCNGNCTYSSYDEKRTFQSKKYSFEFLTKGHKDRFIAKEK